MLSTGECVHAVVVARNDVRTHFKISISSSFVESFFFTASATEKSRAGRRSFRQKAVVLKGKIQWSLLLHLEQ